MHEDEAAVPLPRSRIRRGNSSSRAVLHHRELSVEQANVEERIRTLCLCVCALGVVSGALYYLRAVLVPLVLALALKYLLEPLISALTRPIWFCREPTELVPRGRARSLCRAVLRLRLPRPVAVVVALSIAFATLVLLGLIVADSVRVFTAKADTYSAQVQKIYQVVLQRMDREGLDKAARSEKLKQLTEQVPVTQFIFSVVESLLEMLSNLFLVLLFTVYLLTDHSGLSMKQNSLDLKVNEQIYQYIKGKVLLSLLTGWLTTVILWLLRIDLWLVFGVLAFWLNFVPNVGAMIAVALPLPVAFIDPNVTNLSATLAFLLPMVVHGVVGNVLEPVLFGHGLEIKPVVVLLSLLLWGSLWGVTGMVLAVPMTAVVKIWLEHIDHPLPRAVVWLLNTEGHPDRSPATSVALDDPTSDNEAPTDADVEMQALLRHTDSALDREPDGNRGAGYTGGSASVVASPSGSNRALAGGTGALAGGAPELTCT